MSEEATAAGSPTDGGGQVISETPGGAEGSAQAGATSTPDWGTFRSTLGDLGKEKSLDVIKDFGGLAKSYVEAQRMIGNSIRLPGKDMKPEDRAAAVKAITDRLRKEGVLESVPDAPDGYQIAFPQEEGWTPNEPLITGLKGIAHKLGIPQSKVQGLFDWYLNYQVETQATEQAEFEEMKASLKKELGGLYPRRMEAARRAVAKYLGTDGDQIISNLPPAVGKKLVLAFAEIGDPMLEDELAMGHTMQGVESKEELQKKILAMMGDKNHPLNDLAHPGHSAAVAEYTKLNQMFSATR